MDGRLRDVPAAESDQDWPKKPLIESYPVQEKVNIWESRFYLQQIVGSM